MDYAYLDSYGILHVVDREADAKQYASGKIVEADISHGEGFPEVNGQHVIVYTDKGEYKIGGSMYPISQLDKLSPQIAELVNKLK